LISLVSEIEGRTTRSQSKRKLLHTNVPSPDAKAQRLDNKIRHTPKKDKELDHQENTNAEVLEEQKKRIAFVAQEEESIQSHSDMEDSFYPDGDEYDDEFYMEQDVYSEGEEEDLGFRPVVADINKKKPYEVDYDILKSDTLQKQQLKECEHVSDVCGIPVEFARILLNVFKSNKERLLEKFMDSPEKVLKDAGLSSDAVLHDKARFIGKPETPDYTCEICYMSAQDDPEMEILRLPCQHSYCLTCYRHYLTQKIKEEGEVRQILCAASNCKQVIDEKTIELTVDPETYERYRALSIKAFVDDSENLRWCTAAGCDNIVQCSVKKSQLDVIVPSVTCSCGNQFCFGCSLPDHAPCVCFLVKLWLKKCADDSETSNWISAHTKECSKCHASIEKNGGCNHMTCKTCKFEFCWICLGPWSEHGNSFYNCNRYDEKSSKDARDAQSKSRAQLERYLHYFNRYANHEQSAKLASESFAKVLFRCIDVLKLLD
jgi:ariadne-1